MTTSGHRVAQEPVRDVFRPGNDKDVCVAHHEYKRIVPPPDVEVHRPGIHVDAVNIGPRARRDTVDGIAGIAIM